MLWHGKNFRGILNKASQVLFDKIGTTLNSTNVQDAICEIDSNLANVSLIDSQYVDTSFGRVIFEKYSNGQKMVHCALGSYSQTGGAIIVPFNDIPAQMRPIADTLILVDDNSDNANLGYLYRSAGLGVFKGLTGLYINAIYF